jgi:hypothetical protein
LIEDPSSIDLCTVTVHLQVSARFWASNYVPRGRENFESGAWISWKNCFKLKWINLWDKGGRLYKLGAYLFY